MTLTEYDALIQRLEQLEAADPRSYRRRVAGLAVSGYLYVVAALVLTLVFWGAVTLGSGLVGMVWLALVGGVAFVYSLAQALQTLFVRMDAPQGHPLTREHSRWLHDELDRLSRQLDAPRIHQVLLVGDYNAAMVQTPRLGLFGWYRNTMVLGLPLLLSLSTEELRAVLGHELGHAAGDHSRFAGFIYRLRQVWLKLHQAILAQERSMWLFQRFFDKFVPYFNAYSFVLARAHEYEADQASAQVTSAEVASRALLRVHLDNAWLDEHFWKELGERNKHQPTPPSTLYHEMAAVLERERDVEEQALALERALGARTDLSDTHPSLRRRLEALGGAPCVPAPHEACAAEVCFGDGLAELLDLFNTQWREAMGPMWHMTHLRHQEHLERLGELEGAIAERGDALDAERFLEYASLVETQRDVDEALQLYREHLEREPDSAGARFAIGRVMLQEERDEGLALLEEAIEHDAMFTGHVCQLALDYEYTVRDDKAAAQEWLERLERWQQKIAAAQYERRVVGPEDLFARPDLDPDERDRLAFQLAACPEVKRAWIARKEMTHFPDQPLLVLGVRPNRLRAFTRTRQRELVQRIANELALAREVLVFNLADPNLRWLEDALSRTRGAGIELPER